MKTTTSKHKKLKLDLKREHIRILNTEELTLVAGGGAGENSIRTASGCPFCVTL